jgi:hypothetical protein
VPRLWSNTKSVFDTFEEDFLFAASGLSERDAVDFIFGLGVCKRYRFAIQDPKRYESSLGVRKTIVFERNGRPDKDSLSVHKVQSMDFQIYFPLCLIPGKPHSRSVYTLRRHVNEARWSIDTAAYAHAVLGYNYINRAVRVITAAKRRTSQRTGPGSATPSAVRANSACFASSHFIAATTSPECWSAIGDCEVSVKAEPADADPNNGLCIDLSGVIELLVPN